MSVRSVIIGVGVLLIMVVVISKKNLLKWPAFLQTQNGIYQQIYQDTYATLKEKGTIHPGIRDAIRTTESTTEQIIFALDYQYAYTDSSMLWGIDERTAEEKLRDAAVADAVNTFFTKKYGRGFWKQVKQKADSIDQIYEPLMQEAIDKLHKNYQSNGCTNNFEVTQLTQFQDLPIQIKLNSNNLDQVRYEVTDKGTFLKFKATKQARMEDDCYKVPGLSFLVYVKDFPYKNIALRKIRLQIN